MKKIIGVISTATFLTLSNPAFAVRNEPIETISLRTTGVPDVSMQSFITGAIRLVLVVAALAFFFTLVIGGIQWILSGGEKTGAESARKKITGALIGLAIVFLAWAIAGLIKSLFGVDVLDIGLVKFTSGSAPTP